MAYQVSKDSAATIRHDVRDIAGTLMTGEADNITTALEDGSGSSSSNTVSVSEIGTTGWYSIAFTPDSVGNWVLTVTNPSGSDLAVSRYIVTAVAGATSSAVDSYNLTTLARVKERLFSGEDPLPSTHDTLLADLILEVSEDITNRLGRKPIEDTYTEYADGTGGSLLQLRQGPLVSVTSVVSIEYSGTTTLDETETTVNVADYLLRGLRSDNHLGKAWLERRNGGIWTAGSKNYKVVYVAGFASIPNALMRPATNEVIYEFFSRETHGLASKTIGEAGQGHTLLSPVQRENALDRAIMPFKSWALA